MTRLLAKPDGDERVALFRKWHRDLMHPSCLMQDLDNIEFGYIDGKIVPCGLIELVAIKDDILSNVDAYLRGTLSGFRKRAQGELSLVVAEALNVPGFIVAFSEDLQSIWVINLKVLRTDTYPPWKRISQKSYKSFLRDLRIAKNIPVPPLEEWLRSNASVS